MSETHENITLKNGLHILIVKKSNRVVCACTMDNEDKYLIDKKGVVQ